MAQVIICFIVGSKDPGEVWRKNSWRQKGYYCCMWRPNLWNGRKERCPDWGSGDKGEGKENQKSE